MGLFLHFFISYSLYIEFVYTWARESAYFTNIYYLWRMKHFEILLTLSRNLNVRIVSVKFAINPEIYIEITIFNTSIYVATIAKVFKQLIIRYINEP